MLVGGKEQNEVKRDCLQVREVEQVRELAQQESCASMSDGAVLVAPGFPTFQFSNQVLSVTGYEGLTRAALLAYELHHFRSQVTHRTGDLDASLFV